MYSAHSNSPTRWAGSKGHWSRVLRQLARRLAVRERSGRHRVAADGTKPARIGPRRGVCARPSDAPDANSRTLVSPFPVHTRSETWSEPSRWLAGRCAQTDAPRSVGSRTGHVHGALRASSSAYWQNWPSARAVRRRSPARALALARRAKSSAVTRPVTPTVRLARRGGRARWRRESTRVSRGR